MTYDVFGGTLNLAQLAQLLEENIDLSVWRLYGLGASQLLTALGFCSFSELLREVGHGILVSC